MHPQPLYDRSTSNSRLPPTRLGIKYCVVSRVGERDRYMRLLKSNERSAPVVVAYDHEGYCT